MPRISLRRYAEMSRLCSPERSRRQIGVVIHAVGVLGGLAARSVCDRKPSNVIGTVYGIGNPLVYVSDRGASPVVTPGKDFVFKSVVDEECIFALTTAHEIAHGLGIKHVIEEDKLKDVSEIEELQRLASRLMFPFDQLPLDIKADPNIRKFLGDEIDQKDCEAMFKKVCKQEELFAERMCERLKVLSGEELKILRGDERFIDGRCERD